MLLLAVAGSDATADPVAQNMDAGAIRAQQAQIRTDVVARTGRYAKLSEAQRQDLLAKQDVVNRLLEGRSAITDLPESDRISVFNALEAISAIINNEEDDRMVCKRHKPVGSNRPQTVCKTVAQLRAEQRSVQADEGRRTLECSNAYMGPGGCQ
jgi:hypothetical protein